MFLRTLTVLLFISVTAQAQVDLAYFVDHSARVKGAQVISGEFDTQFKQCDTDLNFGITSSAIWLKYSLMSAQPGSRWLLTVDNPLLDYVTYYDKETDGQWMIHQSGAKRSRGRSFVFNVPLSDTVRHTYFIRLASSHPLQVHLKLQRESEFLKDTADKEICYGILFGALLILAVYHGLLYFKLRDVGYIGYVGFVLANLLLLATSNGYIFYLPSLMVVATAVFCMLLIRRPHVAFITIATLGIVNIFLKSSVSIYTGNALMVICCVAAFLIVKANRFYTLGIVVLLCSELVSVFVNSGVIGDIPNLETASLLEAVLFALALTDRRNQDKKENETPHLEMLKIQQEENDALSRKIAEYNTKLEQVTTELKQTQGRLVQKEKFASLGDLTNNIAHEIQDPLNFVNNFTELSEGLINELKCGFGQELLVEQLKSNLHKIAHHGKRADAIVKGMLSHSRINKGEKRFISLNALTEESLQLSLQSFKTKNKEFDLRLNREFDHSIPQFECNPQELDSVLANLYANAFYAMQQKTHVAGVEYHPELTVRTRNTMDWMEIIVHDNGTGIDPLSVKKVFQPFFTTKPGHQGTGLGLSLSHGIIVKGLDGELTVRSEENVFTEFTIRLPN
jgi:two-component system, NtrC family, sensor kinase